MMVGTRVKTLFKNKSERKRLLFYSLMIALPLAQVAIFYFGVNINSILLAFKEYEGGDYHWIGFENFRNVLTEIFTDPTAEWRFAFKNTFIAWIVCTGIGMTLALFFSYYLFKKGIGKNFFRVMLFMPSIISSIVMVILFTYFVDSFIPELAMRYFGAEIRGLLSNPDTTMLMIYLYNILMGFGTNVLLLSSAMSSVSDSIVEAAQLDGANNLQLFWHVVFPQIFPTFVTIFIVSVANLFANQLNLYSFYGAYAEAKYVTVGYLLYKRTVSAANAQYPELATIGILLTIIIIPVTLGLRKLLEKVGPSDE